MNKTREFVLVMPAVKLPALHGASSGWHWRDAWDRVLRIDPAAVVGSGS